MDTEFVTIYFNTGVKEIFEYRNDEYYGLTKGDDRIHFVTTENEVCVFMLENIAGYKTC